MVAFAQQPIPKKPSKKGNIGNGLRYGWKGDELVRQYGEESKEALDMYRLAIEEYKKCIQNGKKLLLAHHYLGQLYYITPVPLRDLDEAMNHLLDAEKKYLAEKKLTDIMKGQLSMLYNDIGQVYYIKGDFDSALFYYEKASHNRYAGSIAWLYWQGLGTEQDLPKAQELYQKAAIAGSDVWANIYAIELQIKEYQEEYDNKAMLLFLDYLYLKSIGKKENIWMEKLIASADLDYPPAQTDLWVIYRDREKYAKGMPYLQRAIDANYVPALFHIGYVYHMGLGEQIDCQQAQKWYEKAAIEGYPLAQSNLGTLYFSNQIALPQGYSSKDMAYYWWNLAAQQGYTIAVYNKERFLADYSAPKNKFEIAGQVINSIASVMESSLNIYNSLNKSKIQAYNPATTSFQTRQNTYVSTKTPSSSRDITSSCSHQQQLYNQNAEHVKYWMKEYRDEWSRYLKDKAAGKTGPLYNLDTRDEFKQIQLYQNSMKHNRKICPEIQKNELETITPKEYLRKYFNMNVDN